MSRKQKKRIHPISNTVTATPERLRQIGTEFDEMSEVTAGGILKKTGAIRRWTPLENLYRNRLITGPQFDAGEKLYLDHYIGFVASAHVTMQLSDFVSGSSGADNSSMDAAERKVFHQKRYREANKVLDLFDVRKPIHWLIFEEIKPQYVGHRFRGYRGKDKAASSGTTTVAIALQGLARFYGLVK